MTIDETQQHDCLDSGKAGHRSAEQKRKKFRELIELRVPKAIWSIRNIGKLANTYAYDFRARDIEKIMWHLRKELDEMETRFERALSRETLKFTLDD